MINKNKVKAFVESKNNHGETALHIAARNNSCVVLMELINTYEANIDEVDNEKRTPLFLAARFSNLKYLLVF